MELQVPARSHQNVTVCINYYTEFFMQRCTQFVCVSVSVCRLYATYATSQLNEHYYKLVNHAIFINCTSMNNPK